MIFHDQVFIHPTYQLSDLPPALGEFRRFLILGNSNGAVVFKTIRGTVTFFYFCLLNYLIFKPN